MLDVKGGKEAQKSVVGNRGEKKTAALDVPVGFIRTPVTGLFPVPTQISLLSWREGQQVPLKQWYLSARLHDIFPEDFNLVDCEKLKYHSQFLLKQTSQNC